MFTNVMDQLAPPKRKEVQMDMKQPWYNEQVVEEIWHQRLTERKWKSTTGEYDYNALKQKTYYHDLFNNISRDTGKLYAEAKKLLFRKEATPLPDDKDPKIIS